MVNTEWMYNPQPILTQTPNSPRVSNIRTYYLSIMFMFVLPLSQLEQILASNHSERFQFQIGISLYSSTNNSLLEPKL